MVELERLATWLTSPCRNASQDSPAIHGYSAGIYYSMPVFIELLLQLTSGGVSSVYTNPGLGNYETVVPIALLHSLVVFGGLSLGAAKIRWVPTGTNVAGQ